MHSTRLGGFHSWDLPLIFSGIGVLMVLGVGVAIVDMCDASVCGGRVLAFLLGRSWLVVLLSF